ncbi:hypothetical protein BpHYR1_031483 [Brachionus plicatilis]|uniref:Uncharacterized protein n=1 Tax=Brachionus plicatilis TaxID=10195 RepID=A0A3M7PAZ2_BRAPC|nr:hypothetical protein BpHYR1_031483 [Brachionus plicatilis]
MRHYNNPFRSTLGRYAANSRAVQ